MDAKSRRHYRGWLILMHTKGIGHHTCYKLLCQFGSPENILEGATQDLLEFGLKHHEIQALKSVDEKKVDFALAWLAEPAHHLITIHDQDYPTLLRDIHAPPVALFAVGQRFILQQACLAIVGSRNPTAHGKKIAHDFAYELATIGFPICSGLALGIDYQAHLGALKAKQPTIAVLGNGLDRIYPAKHKHLAAEIKENGLLMSEYFPGTTPLPRHFPQRNRIISGISVGVLVVEAARKSGSLITAKYAMEQAREVFAIPGSIHNPLAKGTHSLIKQGAKLVETIGDITEELSFLTATTLPEKQLTTDAHNKSIGKLGSEYAKLLDCMGYDDISIDDLVKLSGLTADVVSSMLLVLELQGLVGSRHGGMYCRSK